MPVRCLKSPPNKPLAAKDPPPVPIGPQNLKMNVGVNQAVLLMLPKNYTGHCPVEVNASGTIVTNGETAVKYRFESDKGELSPVYTVQVDQTHTAYVIAKFKLGKFATGGAASTFTAPSDPPSGGQGLSDAPKLQAAPTQAGVYLRFLSTAYRCPEPACVDTGFVQNYLHGDHARKHDTKARSTRNSSCVGR